MSVAHLLTPVEHLLHLLRKRTDDGKQFGSREMVGMAHGGVEERAKVIAALDKAFPGTLARLERTWRWHGSTACHLWHLPVVVDLSPAALVKTVQSNLKVNVSAPGARRLDGQLTMGGQTRIAGVELSDNILLANVRQSGWTSWHYEDDDKKDVYTRDVEVALDLTREKAILEVYATLQDARVAATAFVELVLGEELPEPGPKRDKVMKPIIFTQSMVASVAARLKTGGESGVGGNDAKNEFGEVRYYGKQEGTVLLPLVDSERTRSQTSLKVKNHFREFMLTHKHVDGYEHRSNVQFYFKSGQHPHLKFKNKTSRPAVYRVVDEICAQAMK